MRTPRYDTKTHSEPIDGYTLAGAQWDRVYPEPRPTDRCGHRSQLPACGAAVDLYRGRIDSLDSPSTCTRHPPTPGARAPAPFEDLYRLHATQPWLLRDRRLRACLGSSPTAPPRRRPARCPSRAGRPAHRLDHGPHRRPTSASWRASPEHHRRQRLDQRCDHRPRRRSALPAGLGPPGSLYVPAGSAPRSASGCRGRCSPVASTGCSTTDTAGARGERHAADH